MKGKLKTTSILESHGKVGPFFLKEMLGILAVLTFLGLLMINLDIYFKIRFIYVVGVPVSFLSIITAIRYFFIKKITSPSYIYDWITHRFFWPRSIRGGSSSFKRKTK